MLELTPLNHVPAGPVDAQTADFEQVLAEVVAALDKMRVLPANMPPVRAKAGWRVLLLSSPRQVAACLQYCWRQFMSDEG